MTVLDFRLGKAMSDAPSRICCLETARVPTALPPVEKSSAILINCSRLTETSLIVHWCSAEFGLIKTVAKGALRPKSPLAGRLDLFVTCEVVVARSARSDLHQLQEAQLTESRLPLRESYLRVLAATYFCKLVELVAERETPLGPVHELLRLSLDYLSGHEPSERLVHRYESRLCSELGLGQFEQGGAVVLQDVFHRPMPPQRAVLFAELAKAKPSAG
ncbi:MAG: DNA repair protein RecO [Roseimicrobium sp.]